MMFAGKRHLRVSLSTGARFFYSPPIAAEFACSEAMPGAFLSTSSCMHDVRWARRKHDD
jgi:hypothetical protein